MAGDPGFFGKLLALPFQGGDQAEIIQDPGPQLGGNPADGLHGLIDQLEFEGFTGRRIAERVLAAMSRPDSIQRR